MTTPDCASELSDAGHGRLGPVPSLFSAYFATDTNSTASGLPGPGRVLGQALSFGGRRLEAALTRACALAGLGLLGTARRLLLRLRGRHAKCKVWPSFSSAQVMVLAIELGHGCCLNCGERYLQELDKTADPEVETLLARMIPSLESAQLENRVAGAHFLAVLAMAHSALHSALIRHGALIHAETSLHACRGHAWKDSAWGSAVQSLHVLVQVLSGALPDDWFDIENFRNYYVLELSRKTLAYTSVLQSKFAEGNLISDVARVRLASVHLAVPKSLVVSHQVTAPLLPAPTQGPEKVVSRSKVILIGASCTGKSTLQKELVYFTEGLSIKEQDSWKSAIRDNLLRTVYDSLPHRSNASPKALALPQIDIDSQDYPLELLQTLAEEVVDDPSCRAALEDGLQPTHASHTISFDSGHWPGRFLGDYISHDTSAPCQAIDHENSFRLLRTASTICAENYLPSKRDILSCRVKTTGTTITPLMLGTKPIDLIDMAGARPERKKWIHHFANADCVIFCAALTDYNLVMREESEVNRMAESLTLFRSIVNSQWFVDSSIVLLMTKVDVLESKLLRFPLGDTFSDYTGGTNVEAATEYIIQHFLACRENPQGPPVHVFVTNITESYNTEKFVSLVGQCVGRGRKRPGKSLGGRRKLP